MAETNETTHAEAAEAVAEPVQEPSEEDRYWKNVVENPADFHSWSYLIQVVEKQVPDLEKIRKVYDQFLVEFPLCYVYWKKYAEHESSGGNVEKAIEVYERGVHGIPYSVDIWTYYCAFVTEKSGYATDRIRSIWERAASTIGLDFASHTFWDKYIEFESNLEETSRVTALYSRIIAIPLDQSESYSAKYTAHVSGRPLAELFNPEEAAAFEAEKGEQEAKYREAFANKPSGEIQPDDLKKQGVKTLEDLEAEFRAKVMASREQLVQQIAQAVEARRAFETGVQKRPYFHVKALDESQIVNWRKYLEFEEQAQNQARIVQLYERCLIACSYYSEFWLRYTDWLEKHKLVEQARQVFIRATTIFLKRRPDVHLEYAAFEESHSNVDQARKTYEHVTHMFPGHIESTLRAAGFEKRQHNNKAATAMFEAALSLAISDAKTYSFLSMQYARFQENAGDLQAARRVFETAVQHHPEYKNLWLAYINFEASHNGQPDSWTHLQKIFSKALGDECTLSQEAKQELWPRYLEFAASADDVQTYRQLSMEYRKTDGVSKAQSRKRALADADPSDSAKIARSNAYAAPAAQVAPAAAAYPGYPQYAPPAAGAYAAPAAGGYAAPAATNGYAAPAANGYSYSYPYGYYPYQQ